MCAPANRHTPAWDAATSSRLDVTGGRHVPGGPVIVKGKRQVSRTPDVPQQAYKCFRVRARVPEMASLYQSIVPTKVAVPVSPA